MSPQQMLAGAAVIMSEGGCILDTRNTKENLQPFCSKQVKTTFVCSLAGQDEAPTDGSASKSSCTGQVALKGGALVLFTVHQAGLQFSCFPVVLEPGIPLQCALRSRKHAQPKQWCRG